MMQLFALMLATSTMGVVLDQPSLELGPHVIYFEDQSGEVTIAQLRSGQFDAKFQKHKRDVPNFGISDSAYWFKVEVTNALDESNLVFSNRYGLIDNFRIYLDREGYPSSPRYGGDHIPFTNKHRPHKSIHFPIVLEKGERATFWIRAQTHGSMQMPLFLEVESAFDTYALEDTALWACFYGIMLAMFFYHFLIFISLRDIQYLLCSIFLLLILLTNSALNGDTLRYLFPENPYLGNMTIPPLLAYCNGCVFIFGLNFLEIKSWSAFWHKVFKLLFIGYVVIGTASFFLHYNQAVRLTIPIVIVSPVIVFIGAFMRWRSGYRPARFFLMAWPILLSATILGGLQKKGILPSTFLIDAMQILGSIAGATLVAFALADKIQILQGERNAAARALRSSHEQLALALDEAHEANMVKSHFLANMSHEVRTPLNALLNLPPLVLQAISCDYLWECKACSIQFQDDLLTTMDDPRVAHCPDCEDQMYVVAFQPLEVSMSEQRVMLNRVQDSAHELNNILSGVLDYAQIEAGFLKLATERVSAQDLVHDASVLVTERHKSCIKPHFRGQATEPVWLACDENYILNVLLHLFDNAYKFSPDGSKVSIDLSPEVTDAGMARFTITDEGPGISKEALEVVFQGFRQVDMGHTRSHRGSGLGLAICKGIVEEHGGNIWIENRNQGGTSVSFTVPVHS
ncbi:MAG: sensor histidine kinase [Deltaproteobacteria bacterium]|jgi:two-component system, sensor histidine kinase LadS|nr:sensor histidine kinase [Deltaproteobacteria bacterium]MBT6435237.1 sensor histidine kinase [Deltaproteobacteria bacterium]MBT6490678.1 sensor histidine kinase [Deltaproteobacteria bacterium]